MGLTRNLNKHVTSTRHRSCPEQHIQGSNARGGVLAHFIQAANLGLPPGLGAAGATPSSIGFSFLSTEQYTVVFCFLFLFFEQSLQRVGCWVTTPEC